jgi:nucleoid-associated protein YgaU
LSEDYSGDVRYLKSKQPMKRSAVRKGMWAGAALVVWLAAGARVVFSQSLGEIARRERAARQKQSQHADHVYTNEDFKRPQILTPQDQTRFDASKEAPTTPAAPANVKTLPLTPAIPSVVEAARHYRWLKYMREQERMNASKILPGGPALAAPTRTPLSVPPSSKPRPLAPLEAPRLPEVPWGREVTAEGVRVRRGDSLWKLAARYLGQGERWKQLYAANPQLKNPNLILAGEWLRLPQSVSAPASGSARVQAGDTLWKLAQAHFGNGMAWGCIAQANPQFADPNRIYPGQTVAIPEHCGSLRASLAPASPSGP